MTDFLNEQRAGRDAINNATSELVGIARAFYMTGNTEMHDKLWRLIDAIGDGNQKIDNAVCKDINDKVKQGQQAISDTLTTIVSSMNKE